MRDLSALSTTDDQYHSLWDSVHRSRSTSKTTSFDKQAVTNLLLDHCRMLTALYPHETSPQKKAQQ